MKLTPKIATYLLAGHYVKVDEQSDTLSITETREPGHVCLGDYPPTEIRSIIELSKRYERSEIFDPANTLTVVDSTNDF